MAITYDGAKIALEAIVYEDEVVALREKLTQIAPEEVSFDLSNCDDVHLAVIQQMLTYKKLYTCNFNFSQPVKSYQKIIEGFDENDCNI